MLHFVATCGRGLDKYLAEEIQEKRYAEVCIEEEGKIYFRVLNSPKTQNLSEKLEYFDIYKHGLTSDYKDDQPKFKANELFELKYAERIFLLLHYEAVLEDSFKGVMDIKNILQHYKLDVIQETIDKLNITSERNTDYLKCENPETCSAFLERSKELSKRKNKEVEDPEAMNKKQKIPDEFTNKAVWGTYAKANKLKQKGTLIEQVIAARDNNVENATKGPEQIMANNMKMIQEIFSNRFKTPNQKEQRFRVSCRITGARKHSFNRQKTTNKIVKQLETLNSNWQRHFSTDNLIGTNNFMDIFVNLTDKFCFIGAALTPKPLSLRPYIRHINLRSTICHLMLKLSKIGEGHVLLDPMCGIGSILTEAAYCYNLGRILGNDISPKQINGAKCNLSSSPVPYELTLGDISDMNLQDNSIDAIVCDFPFGSKHQSVNNPEKDLFHKLLQMCSYVLKPAHFAVILISTLQVSFLDEKQSFTYEGNTLEITTKSDVSLGRTDGCIYVFQKACRKTFKQTDY